LPERSAAAVLPAGNYARIFGGTLAPIAYRGKLSFPTAGIGLTDGCLEAPAS
jgi:hypothetical protein